MLKQWVTRTETTSSWGNSPLPIASPCRRDSMVIFGEAEKKSSNPQCRGCCPVLLVALCAQRSLQGIQMPSSNFVF